jgi:hypothetical protein
LIDTELVTTGGFHLTEGRAPIAQVVVVVITLLPEIESSVDGTRTVDESAIDGVWSCGFASVTLHDGAVRIAGNRARDAVEGRCALLALFDPGEFAVATAASHTILSLDRAEPAGVEGAGAGTTIRVRVHTGTRFLVWGESGCDVSQIVGSTMSPGQIGGASGRYLEGTETS